jgi:hypothetical protein
VLDVCRHFFRDEKCFYGRALLLVEENVQYFHDDHAVGFYESPYFESLINREIIKK